MHKVEKKRTELDKNVTQEKTRATVRKMRSRTGNNMDCGDPSSLSLCPHATAGRDQGVTDLLFAVRSAQAELDQAE